MWVWVVGGGGGARDKAPAIIIDQFCFLQQGLNCGVARRYQKRRVTTYIL